nr:metallophosphoesterase [Salinivirgaceae bacterium]
FHFGELTNKYFITQFIDKINAINPDIVLLAGDIVEAEQSSSKMEFFEAQLREIKTKYGVYAIEGNHDIYSRKNSYNFLENANVKILRDTVIKIEKSFYLIGRKDRHNRKRQSIPNLLKNTCDSLPVFLLDHQPYNLENTYNNDINIQFSGHTHHGQLFPLNFITEKIYELSWGYRKIQNTHFFVTCGAQGWGPQVKTASQSEIIEVDIDFY